MDTKFIAMVGALIVLGGAVYFIATGDVLPGGDDGSIGVNGVDNGTSGDDTQGTDQNETAQNETELAENGTEEVEEEVVPTTVECQTQDGDVEVENVYSDAGPPLDERKAESMLHDAVNKLRDAQTGIETEPLLCDPGVREVAQEHATFMAQKEFVGSNRPDGKGIIERYANACTESELSDSWEGGPGNEIKISQDDTVDEIENNLTLEVREFHGRWLYQRNQNLDWGGVGLKQRVELITDYDDLVRDIRGAWVNGGLDEFMSDIHMDRGGAGIHIDRETRLVHVTYAVCGTKPIETEPSEQ